MLIPCSERVMALLGFNEGTSAIDGCNGIVSPEKEPSFLDTRLECVSGGGCVMLAGVAELVDGDATERGCGGRGMGNGALVLSAGTAMGCEDNLEDGSGDGCGGELGDNSAGGGLGIGDRVWGVSVGGRLPRLLPKPDCGLGEEGAGELGTELMGGLIEMRMLTSGELNI